MGLNSDYNTTRASMHVKSNNGGNNFNNGNNSKGNFENKRNLNCTFCKKSDHTATKCYRLIGFPKDFKFTKNKNVAAHVSGFQPIGENESKETAHITSQQLQRNHTFCKKSGHTATKCYRLIGFPKDFKFTKNKNVAAHVSGFQPIGENESKETVHITSQQLQRNHSMQELTNEQYHQLCSLLSKLNDNNSEGNRFEDQNIKVNQSSAHMAGPFSEEATRSWAIWSTWMNAQVRDAFVDA
ncbi:unnamed protein product [Lactuca virosa]|uniref:Uncharacterized protein n=1 Tax=Lactuca virosa TaxID=75947 RepID=A0AAU9NWB7_9ASTR|nr:unnamed protein product [Lactuca virosa]